MRKITISILIVAMFVVAPITVQTVKASTTTDLQAQIAMLLQMVTKLQQQLLQKSALQNNSQSTSSGISSSVQQSLCVNLSGNVSLYQRDTNYNTDIAKLSAFLKKSGVYYYKYQPNTIFGTDLEKAVQKWQSLHGIVSYGSPETTGYGIVGSRTRKAMSCGNQNLNTATTRSIYISNIYLGNSYSQTTETFVVLYNSMPKNVGLRIIDASGVTVLTNNGSIPSGSGSTILVREDYINGILPAGYYRVQAFNTESMSIYATSAPRFFTPKTKVGIKTAPAATVSTIQNPVFSSAGKVTLVKFVELPTQFVYSYKINNLSLIKKQFNANSFFQLRDKVRERITSRMCSKSNSLIHEVLSQALNEQGKTFIYKYAVDGTSQKFTISIAKSDCHEFNATVISTASKQP